jgi:hypothetical protein
MDIGFTGTRWGMGDIRRPVVSYIADKLGVTKASHGMCVGSDSEFHELMRELPYLVWIKGHPPIVQSLFADLDCNETEEPKDYLERDRDIVDDSEVMIATPNEYTEKKRGSGTWYTIRYAKKVIKSGKGKCKKLYIVKPNGKVDYFDSEKLNASID